MMLIIFFAIVILLLLYSKFYNKKFFDGYLSKDNTTKVNGFFIILVFFSHFQQYITITNPYDALLYKFVGLIGQLMVTTFFFFSGYGIHESVKNKGEKYIKQFFKHRFLPTYTNWFLAITAFVVLDIILQKSLTIEQVILAYIGWESIGNSSWYLFDIFVLYFLFMISFNLFKKEKMRLYAITFLTIVFIIILSFLKESYVYNTLLCFPLGMFYSYYKEKIDIKIMKNNKNYLISFIAALMLFIVSFYTYRHLGNQTIHLIASCFFVLTISLMMMKFKLKSQILHWCGRNLFWIYILQRIPMMIFKGRFSNYNVYFIVCIISTVLIVYGIDYIKQRKSLFKKSA